ncbi:hypothetical protein HPB47_008500 [Ixodes persulcatus]|uniref:Uncharacterized protein n=1 Tax=Ixodes persulcatus TaxID=34615 RepID=A0AC60P4N2_IXOPE|nr:hypothetical protein HPB47_008500 [Ixodes persulcatus]
MTQQNSECTSLGANKMFSCMTGMKFFFVWHEIFETSFVSCAWDSIPSNPEMWNMDSVKTAVIQLLKEMSQSKLAKICPLKQSLLSTIVNNKFSGKLGAEKCKEFGRWFMDYRQSSPATASTFLDEDKPPQDCRMTFHSGTELPRMREWYRQCPHPTNLQLQDFVNQLNGGALRIRNKPPVTPSSLKNWWKNERQRERRLKRHASVDDPGSPPCPVPTKTVAQRPASSQSGDGDSATNHEPPSRTAQPHHPHPLPVLLQPHVLPTPGPRPTLPYACLAHYQDDARAREHPAIAPYHHHHHHCLHHHANNGASCSPACSTSSEAGELVVLTSPMSHS